MNTADQQLSTVIAFELELLTEGCRGNRARVDDLLHAEFREHGTSGRVWTRDDVVDQFAGDPTFPGRAVNVAAHALADDVVLVTYLIAGGRPSHRSSVWVRADGRWQMRFHQGTPVGA